MSRETANAARYAKGMTVLTDLEGELLEALQELLLNTLPVFTTEEMSLAQKADRAISRGHGE